MLHSSFSSHPDTLRRLGSLLPVVCTHPRSLSPPAVVSPALAMVEEQEKKNKKQNKLDLILHPAKESLLVDLQGKVSFWDPEIFST